MEKQKICVNWIATKDHFWENWELHHVKLQHVLLCHSCGMENPLSPCLQQGSDYGENQLIINITSSGGMKKRESYILREPYICRKLISGSWITAEELCDGCVTPAEIIRNHGDIDKVWAKLSLFPCCCASNRKTISAESQCKSFRTVFVSNRRPWMQWVVTRLDTNAY